MVASTWRLIFCAVVVAQIKKLAAHVLFFCDRLPRGRSAIVFVTADLKTKSARTLKNHKGYIMSWK